MGAATDDPMARPSERVPAAKKRTRRAPLTELQSNVARPPASLSKDASRKSIRVDERLSDKSHDSVAAVSLSTPTSTEEEVITFQDQPPPFMEQAVSFRIISAWSEEQVGGDVAATAGEERPSSSRARRPARTPAATAARTPRADAADTSATASRSSDASARQPRRARRRTPRAQPDAAAAATPPRDPVLARYLEQQRHFWEQVEREPLLCEIVSDTQAPRSSSARLATSSPRR